MNNIKTEKSKKSEKPEKTEQIKKSLKARKSKFSAARLFVYFAVLSACVAAAFGQKTDAPHVLRGHTAGVTAVEFSRDGNWLASASLDGTMRVWTAPDWKNARIFKHGAELYALAVSADGKTLVSGGYDRRLIFWETKTGKKRFTVEMPDWINQIAFTRSGRLVVACESADSDSRRRDRKNRTHDRYEKRSFRFRRFG